jgi:hypothetical protein
MEGRKETRGVGREKSVPFTLYVIRAKISSDFYTPKIEPNLASILLIHHHTINKTIFCTCHQEKYIDHSLILSSFFQKEKTQKF